MEKTELEVAKREQIGTTKSRVLRKDPVIPAIIYGKGMKSLPITVDYKKFEKLIKSKAGYNVLINLKLKDEDKSLSIPVLTSAVQRNPMNGKIIHVDFHKIKMEEKIKTRVRVDIVGQAAGVKDDGGILVQGLREIEVKCLPGDIPESFEVDVTKLKIGNSIHISDLKTGEGIEILTGKDEMVVTISAPTKEEVVEAAATEAAAVPVEGAVPAAEGEKKEAGAKGAAAEPAKAGAKTAAPAKPAATGKPAAPAKPK